MRHHSRLAELRARTGLAEHRSWLPSAHILCFTVLTHPSSRVLKGGQKFQSWPGMAVVHMFSPSTQETEAGGL